MNSSAQSLRESITTKEGPGVWVSPCNLYTGRSICWPSELLMPLKACGR
jgi:hypothetical protein